MVWQGDINQRRVGQPSRITLCEHSIRNLDALVQSNHLHFFGSKIWFSSCDERVKILKIRKGWVGAVARGTMCEQLQVVQVQPINYCSICWHQSGEWRPVDWYHHLTPVLLVYTSVLPSMVVKKQKASNMFGTCSARAHCNNWSPFEKRSDWTHSDRSNQKNRSFRTKPNVFRKVRVQLGDATPSQNWHFLGGLVGYVAFLKVSNSLRR